MIFNTGDNGYVGADLAAGGSTNNFNVEQRFNISDIFYWTRGNMSWKMGVDLSDARLNVVPFFAASGGRWQFRTVQTNNTGIGAAVANGGNDIASFLLGTPNVTDFRPVLLSYYYQWKSGALFVRSDWKVKPNFMLNLGLRYSLQYPRVEKNNLQGVFRPDPGAECDAHRCPAPGEPLPLSECKQPIRFPAMCRLQFRSRPLLSQDAVVDLVT